MYFEKIESTNVYAKENNICGDTLVITDNQISGKGRFERKWISTPGEDLTFTLVKKFILDNSHIQLVNFYSSLILFETLKKFFGSNNELNFFLKWPNDILLNGKKLAGILLDVSDMEDVKKKFVMGFGVNVNTEKFQHELSGNATSLFLETGNKILREKLLIKFVKNFYRDLDLLNDKEKLISRWLQNSKIKGRKVRFQINEKETETAVVLGVETDGAISLKFESGEEKKYYSGQIIL